MVSEKVATEAGVHEYELVIVIKPDLAEGELEAAIDKVARFLTARGGVIANTAKWGKRKLAYQIKHFGEGNYVVFRFKSKPVYGRELEANLRISEEVLRHLLVKLE